jgi:3-mercaptopyruvate sulfurtransferase SseA
VGRVLLRHRLAGERDLVLAYLQGWERIAVYDGGWFEWSQDPLNNPIEIGDPDAAAPQDEYAA